MQIQTLRPLTYRITHLNSQATYPKPYEATLTKLHHKPSNITTTLVLGISQDELTGLRKLVSIFLDFHKTKRTSDLQETYFTSDMLITQLTKVGIKNPQQLINRLKDEWLLIEENKRNSPHQFSLDLDYIGNQLNTR